MQLNRPVASKLACLFQLLLHVFLNALHGIHHHSCPMPETGGSEVEFLLLQPLIAAALTPRHFALQHRDGMRYL